MTRQQQVFEADVTVTDPEGIHLRTAAALVRAASRFPNAELLISKGGHEINGKSIMGVLTLVAEKGSRLRFRARGDDAEKLIEVMVAMFQPGGGAVET